MTSATFAGLAVSASIFKDAMEDNRPAVSLLVEDDPCSCALGLVG